MTSFRSIALLAAATVLLAGCGPGPLIGPAGRDTLLMLFLCAIAFAVWRLLTEKPSNRQHRATYLDLVRERYARGEITQDQFNKLKSDLES